MANRLPQRKQHSREKPKAQRPERVSAAKRGYGHWWRKARLIHLAEYPLCTECERQGRVTAATDVDHITPHKGDAVLLRDTDNWQSLCSTCHKNKTAKGE